MFSKPRGRTRFQHEWIDTFPWAEPVATDEYAAKCKYCKTTFNVDSMGRTALKSHSQSKKHISRVKQATTSMPIVAFMKNTQNTITANQPSTSSTVDVENIEIPKEKKMPVIKQYLLGENVSMSEIFWCLQIVKNHIPFRAAARCAQGFKSQFPDSEIASKIQLNRTKVGYLVWFGLAPYFNRQLQHQLKDCTEIVLCFDESLNKISQKQQMDVHIRFWDTSKLVQTRYYTSMFLGHTTASDLLNGIKCALSDELIKKIIQVSMDGPNVNIKLLSDLKKELANAPDSPVMLDIGSCGLHTLHNAFKAGMTATGWDVIGFLRALYNLLKDSPARRCDYMNYSGSNIFPLKFCAVRWLESGHVAGRALEILPNIRKYVDRVIKDKKEPTCNSFAIVKEKLTDKFLSAKLAFFSAICALIEPFLREFQTDQPMVPFLHNAIFSLVFSLCEKVIKKEHLDCIKNQMENIDFTKSENLILVKHVDLGFATKNALRLCPPSSDLEKLQFKKAARDCIIGIIKKIIEKSPLKYKLVKSVTCLDPVLINNDYQLAENRLVKCLDELVAKNWISGLKADKIKKQFQTLFSSPDVKESCKEFRRNKKRLDNFFMDILSGQDEDYEELKMFIKIILTMSHGNASVERGFSINKECIVQNLQEESLIALRQICDGIDSAGGIDSFLITKDLIHSARNANARYKECLFKKGEDENARKNALKEMKFVDQRRKELEAEKAKVLCEAQKRTADIEEKISELSKKKKF